MTVERALRSVGRMEGRVVMVCDDAAVGLTRWDRAVETATTWWSGQVGALILVRGGHDVERLFNLVVGAWSIHLAPNAVLCSVGWFPGTGGAPPLAPWRDSSGGAWAPLRYSGSVAAWRRVGWMIP